MRKLLLSIILLLLFHSQILFAQSATFSYPFSIGKSGTCGSGSDEVHFYNYSGATNVISNASGGLVSRYTPELRIGTSNASAQRFTSNYSSVSFNPADHKIYFLWTATSGALAPGGPRTYIWSWPIGTTPTSTSPRLDTIASFQADILGIVFDNNGKAYDIEFIGAKAPYKPIIRSVDFATRTFGAADNLVLTGGVTINNYTSGDVAVTPSGQMFFVVDNKLFTPDYKSYTGTGANLTCTYVGPVSTGSGSLVGLTYADGEMIGSISGSGCPYKEINLLTAAVNSITGSVASTADMATVVSGIGAAKNLVSVTPTGTPMQYDVVYDIYVKNYGNMDVNNVQVTDDLTAINGAGNVSNVTTSFVSNPAGLVLNPSFNGNSNKNLLNGTGTLPNYPVANNNVIIRIKCRLSNIKDGVVYNNSATATAKDFNGNDLKDISTNGTDPDLNSNDKPDDAGEDQPTPLLISVAATTPPCAALTNILYTQTFGAGTGLTASIPAAVVGTGVLLPTGASLYTGKTAQPLPIESYTVTNNANNANTTDFISLTDHTGDANGRMLVINADASNKVMYRATFYATTCANQQYSLSFYAAFPANAAYKTRCDGFGGIKAPQIRMRIKDGLSGLIITEVSTTPITNSGWQQYGLKFVSPASYTQLIFELVNDAPGGCGNDVALDDIMFGTCDALPEVNIFSSAAGCLGSATTFVATINDPAALPGAKEYQWQVANTLAGPYTAIAGATGATYTIANVTAANVGKYYRVMVAATGNINNASCRYISAGLLLAAKSSSTNPTSASRSKNNVCPGNPVVLSVTGGTLGTNAAWKWYSGSCGGTLVGTGATITVNPTVTTTYFVRAEGDCNVTACVSVTIFISCDIDKDKDGIPDWVESNMPAAFGDANGDGIINAYDPTYPGFVDNNGDFINDNFQADGDSNGDGIPNYLDPTFPGRIDVNGDGVDDRFDADLDGIINMLDLDSDNDGIPDVVEAGGVDTNGDGKLDNFIDADGDGLSDQVDANLSGAYNSGVGLGLKDTDGDGVANQFDLDSDNDGIPDVVEVGGAYSTNNGRLSGFIDLNKDGISDNVVGANALLKTGPDTNGDGRADSYPFKNMDKDSKPNPYDIDSDGDGILDVVEAGFPDVNMDGIVDGVIGLNGWSTSISSMASLNIRNSDGDPNPDYLDIDSDNDGIPDNIEGQTTNGYKMPTTLDTDGDGLADIYDAKPLAFGGHGIFPVDTDGDGFPDYLDKDSDGDGADDISEGNDWNFNASHDEITTLLNVDTDGDGLDDRFDLDNTSAKGTSINLGNGGSFNGDPFPGTRAVVQKSPITRSGDRDWRWILSVLPVNFVDFTGVQKDDQFVKLYWSVIVPDEVNRFEIYRSVDNVHFSLSQTIPSKAQTKELQNFTALDDISGVNTDVIFYRLKVIGAKEKQTVSNIIPVKIAKINSSATIIPNPASDNATIKLYAATESNVVIHLIDNTGRTVMQQQQRVTKGNNLIWLNGLEKFGNGIYNVQIHINDNVVNSKLAIIK